MSFFAAVALLTFILLLGLLETLGEPGRLPLARRALIVSIFGISVYELCAEIAADERRAHVESTAGVVGIDQTRVDEYWVKAGADYFSDASLDVVFGIPMRFALSDDGRVLLTYDVRDERGEVVARIRENEWFDVSDRYDRNFDEHAFEVFDPETSQPVLQIARDGGLAVVQGTLRKPSGQPVYFNPNGNSGRPARLCPWFVYPSELHPAERNPNCLPPDVRYARPPRRAP